MFSYADGCTFSGKKDALTNIGGILATNDKKLFEKFKNMLVVTEGFPTYGGLACRELAAMAIGLQESTKESYLEYRCGQVKYLWEKLHKAGVPIVNPVGGHAVFIDGKKFFPHLPQEQFPAQTLAVELYQEAGVRGVELGTSCFGQPDPKTGKMTLPKLDLLRLTIPRRVYTTCGLCSLGAYKNLPEKKKNEASPNTQGWGFLLFLHTLPIFAWERRSSPSRPGLGYSLMSKNKRLKKSFCSATSWPLPS